MKTLNLLFIFLILATTSIYAQETRPVDDPNFSRAVAPIHPIWDWDEDVTINGVADEGFWSLIEFQTLPLDVTNSWFIEGTIPAAPSAKFDAKWKATMDEDYFYIFVDVTDDNFVPRSATLTNNAWDNDNVELFFLFADTTVVMPDWSLIDASQFRIWPDTNLSYADSITGGGLVIGMRNSLGHLGYMSRTVVTTTGYTVETRIPWILIVPSIDGVMGYEDDDDNFVPILIKELEGFQFDINVADRNNPDAEADPKREFIWSWSANWNRNWGFTEAYGWLEVAEPLSNVSAPVLKNEAFRVYPNPANSRLFLDNLNGYSVINVSNIVGQVVFQTTTDAISTSIDVSGLKNGVYLINVSDEAGNRNVQKFIKN
jgi:hypothetical protein